ncbi:MAG: translation elongation factor Ts [Clostridia bacterium]
MAFTAKDVMELREKTGVGMMDCKKALTETDGNMEKAIDFLREKGMAAVAKKAGRIAAEGIVESYIHMGGKIGVLVEVNCETDFVAKSDAFKELVHDIAIQIAASNPDVVNISEVEPAKLEKEKEILKVQALNEGKPVAIIDRMVEGRVKKYYKEVVLMEQDFVKDATMTIGQLVSNAVIKIGEKITIRRFVRYEMGEGLEKRKDDFAEEVMRQSGQKND